MIDLHKIPASDLLDALKDHPDIADTSPKALANRVISTAEAIFGVSREDLLRRAKQNELSHPRLVAMAALRELGLSLADVGQYFGNRDHGAVIHAGKRVPQLFARDPEFAKLGRAFREALALPPQPPAQISQTYVQRRLPLSNLSNQATP